jgi:hypothetical protein
MPPACCKPRIRLLTQGKEYMNADVLWVSDFQIPHSSPALMEEIRHYLEAGTHFYCLQIGIMDNECDAVLLSDLSSVNTPLSGITEITCLPMTSVLIEMLYFSSIYPPANCNPIPGTPSRKSCTDRKKLPTMTHSPKVPAILIDKNYCHQ